MRKNILKALSSILVVGMLSTGVAVFASTTNSSDTTTTNSSTEVKGRAHGKDQAKGERGGQQHNILDRYKSLLAANIIDEATFNKISEFITAEEATRKAEMEGEKAKVDAMTDSEKEAYITAKKAEREAKKAELTAMTDEQKATTIKSHDGLQKMLDANILTQDQVTAIKAYMEANKPNKPADDKNHKEGKGPEGKGADNKDHFQALVDNQVISQDTSDKITAYITAEKEAKKAEMEAEKAKIDAMTDSEKEAYITAKKAEREAKKAELTAMTDEQKATTIKKHDILQKLVDENIITQADYDAIKAYMKANKPTDDKEKKSTDKSTKAPKKSTTTTTVTE